jgi:exosortase
MTRRLSVAFFGVFCLALFFFNHEIIQSLVRFSMNGNNQASHIVLIPFITATLIWMKKKEIFNDVRYSFIGGTTVIVFGSAASVAARSAAGWLSENDYLTLTVSALVVTWLGGFLLCYGSTCFKKALFPLLFLVFLIPIPSPLLNRVIAALQRASADVAFVLLKLTGTPVHREGFLFQIPGLDFVVAPECSGIRSGISLFIACNLAGHLLLRSMWRRAALVLTAIPILIFKNAIRIDTLTLLAIHFDKRILTSRLHTEGGIPFFVVGLLLLYPVLALLIESERQRAENRSPFFRLSFSRGRI